MLDRCGSRLLSLVTTTSKDRCREFINKVREARFIKIKNRDVNKFNRLVAKMSMIEIITVEKEAHNPLILVINCKHLVIIIINHKPPVLTTSGSSTYPTLPKPQPRSPNDPTLG